MTKHFTSTVYITASIDGEIKVLLHLHKKLQFWIGVGGHVEENENPVEAAIRETKEETGLDVVISSKSTLHTERHAREIPSPERVLEAHIPEYKGTPAHAHIDFAYFAITKTPQNVTMEEQFDWFTKGQLAKTYMPEEVRRIARKAIDSHKKPRSIYPRNNSNQ